ncbi:MAG: putative rane-bound dehydrogenase domain protein, partial [Chthoniobacteraceae bacterium]|nr:putative rane-bound dehydrogenase domain protein [Chthoniobacteraceae bacterium]
NGDGRPDIIEGTGWWEQPALLNGDPVWEKHTASFGGGAQYYAYDVNGDGLADVVGSVAAHGYGVAWWEQVKDAGKTTFRKHLIVGQKPEENRYGVVFSQPHAVELVDMDGDGLKDIVTGKRFWAHGNKGDADPNGASVLYWFKLVRNGKSVDFVPHLVDDNSGVGTQVVVGDVNGDTLPDIVVGNKRGSFVHLAEKKTVSQEAWEKAQPKANPAYVEPGTAPAPSAASNGPVGTLPLGKDGKPLNLDFEDGTLRDWTATGDAFKGQPYKGPIDPNRDFGEGKFANHQGAFWIGGYELLKDAPQGTLTSAPFKVTQPYAAFRLAGGVAQGERVELIDMGTGKVFFIASGRDTETMLPVVVDLQSLKEKEISIRIVDELSVGWGHINFDDFRFYDKKPVFANAAPPAASTLPADKTKFAGLSPEEAVKAMTLPPGFAAKLYAGEPDVKQPIAFAIDDRGRIWVAEAYSYPKRQPEGQGKDRIVVFEDVDGDGKFDKQTVFMEGLNLVSGLEVGFGGVWVGAAPYLMFIPMKDGDEPKPSGPPQILLDGFGFGDTHETLNTFTWGPDGWLYGCHGVFTFSNAGKPGAPESERTKINAGVWRFHPTKHKFELFAEGTSNPWGIDFDEHGQCITEGCVIPHLWHMIQNAHYQRQGGQHFNPNVFDDIKTIADHVHWVGGNGPHAGNGKSDSAGGGHAHAGLMVYLGGSWPAQYRGQAFMNNIHGARLNMDILEPAGSGFVGHHGADFMAFNDLWSQIVNLQYDQDGSLVLIDWYDKNQCHNNDVNAHDRTNGRIFKVVYNEQKTTRVDLQKLSSAELVNLQLNANDWWVRHARRILQERGPNPEVHAALHKMLLENSDPTRRLRALWALHATGGLSEEIALAALNEKDQYVRAWAIQLLCENGEPSKTVVQEFGRLAKTDPSAVVRLYVASAAQRIAPESRWEIAAALNGHPEDSADHNLPLMGWYALESLAPTDLNRTLAIALDSKLPRILEFTSRRLAALNGGLDV